MSMRIKNLLLAVALAASASSASSSVALAEVVATPIAVQPQLDRAAVRSALAQRRAVVIQRFLAYRDARVYPIARTPGAHDYLWVDAGGHFCAAATLVSLDWGREAARLV